MGDRANVVKSTDIIVNSREMVAFLRDVAGSISMEKGISPDGFEGLARILKHVEEELLQAIDLLQAH